MRAVIRTVPTPQSSALAQLITFQHPIPTDDGANFQPRHGAPNTTLRLRNSGTVLPLQRIPLRRQATSSQRVVRSAIDWMRSIVEESSTGLCRSTRASPSTNNGDNITTL